MRRDRCPHSTAARRDVLIRLERQSQCSAGRQFPPAPPQQVKRCARRVRDGREVECQGGKPGQAQHGPQAAWVLPHQARHQHQQQATLRKCRDLPQVRQRVKGQSGVDGNISAPSVKVRQQACTPSYRTAQGLQVFRQGEQAGKCQAADEHGHERGHTSLQATAQKGNPIAHGGAFAHQRANQQVAGNDEKDVDAAGAAG